MEVKTMYKSKVIRVGNNEIILLVRALETLKKTETNEVVKNMCQIAIDKLKK